MAPETTKYAISPRAHAAIEGEMRRRKWVDGKGRPQWSKLVDLLWERRRLRITSSALSQSLSKPGGRSHALRDILAAMGLPTFLAHELDDVDRLVFEAIHDAGIDMLPPAAQKELAEFLKKQVELRVAALAAEKK